MTSFKNSFIQQLLKLLPSRFSSRTLHVPSRIAGFQQGWKRSGFQALGNGTNAAGNVMLFLFPDWASLWLPIPHILLEAAPLFSTCMPGFLPISRSESGQLVGWGSKYPIRLHVTLLYPSRNYEQSGPWSCPGNGQESTSDWETSKKRHQRRTYLLHVSLHVPFTDLHGLQVFDSHVSTFTFPFTYPSRTFTDCEFS